MCGLWWCTRRKRDPETQGARKWGEQEECDGEVRHRKLGENKGVPQWVCLLPQEKAQELLSVRLPKQLRTRGLPSTCLGV